MTDDQTEELREEQQQLEEVMARLLDVLVTRTQELENIEADRKDREPRVCYPVFRNDRVVIERRYRSDIPGQRKRRRQPDQHSASTN